MYQEEQVQNLQDLLLLYQHKILLQHLRLLLELQGQKPCIRQQRDRYQESCLKVFVCRLYQQHFQLLHELQL